MKNFQTAYHTDIGIKKQTNQDSILLNAIAVGQDEILLAVLCDGMGGMAKGELASATVIRAFADWFQQIYANDSEKRNVAKIKKQWTELIENCNDKLIAHGKATNLQLGTTVTALLIWSAGSYFVGHIGDTRIYHLTGKLQQLTDDHTFVAREVKRGNMTKEQAAKDNRRNVLLQCVGVNESFEPQFCEGRIEVGEAFLMCSDGFRHEVTEEELLLHLSPSKLHQENQIMQKLVELVELNKQRQETDNISAIYIKRI